MERFNRFVYLCAVVLYMQDDVNAFLQKHDHISDTLACIVRFFASLDFFPIFCGGGEAIGVHLIQPFLTLLISSNDLQRVDSCDAFAL